MFFFLLLRSDAAAFGKLVFGLGGGPSPPSEVLGPAGPNTKCCCFCVECMGLRFGFIS